MPGIAVTSTDSWRQRIPTWNGIRSWPRVLKDRGACIAALTKRDSSGANSGPCLTSFGLRSKAPAQSVPLCWSLPRFRADRTAGSPWIRRGGRCLRCATACASKPRHSSITSRPSKPPGCGSRRCRRRTWSLSAGGSRRSTEATSRARWRWQMLRRSSSSCPSGVLIPDLSDVQRGPEGMRRVMEVFWGEFDAAHVQVHELIDAGDHVFCSLTVRGRGRKSGAETRTAPRDRLLEAGRLAGMDQTGRRQARSPTGIYGPGGGPRSRGAVGVAALGREAALWTISASRPPTSTGYQVALATRGRLETDRADRRRGEDRRGGRAEAEPRGRSRTRPARDPPGAGPLRSRPARSLRGDGSLSPGRPLHHQRL